MAAQRERNREQSANAPQWQQALSMLRRAGARGVHTFEMRRAFIGNPSQRIAELRELGCTIRVGQRERLHGKAYGVRYFLDAEPAGLAGALPENVAVAA